LSQWNKSAFYSLIMPGGVLLLLVAVVVHTGWISIAPPSLAFFRYCAFGGGALLAGRFHSSRIFLALIVLFLAKTAIPPNFMHIASGTPAWDIVVAAQVLVPVNFILIASIEEHGLVWTRIAPFALFLFVQVVIVNVLSRAPETPGAFVHHVAVLPIPAYALVTFAGAAIFLLVRALVTCKPPDAALFWALAAFFLAFEFHRSARISAAYSVTAFVILAISVVESSYLLAYRDELTNLPSRRAFNDAILRLQAPFSIAAIDIDHFKKFNDTYGHDMGDQVLCLVASRLARVTGGGQAFRCGGEEFAILFPGKTCGEVIQDLERLRAIIENSGFRVRGRDRRQVARGADRRAGRTRARRHKGDAIRQLAQPRTEVAISVTVSIGVAGPSSTTSAVEEVLGAADKALYRAKANGRNRIEISAPRRADRARAAGIA
jgi:diguanylate cyclase (GGDEF)-like protein